MVYLKNFMLTPAPQSEPLPGMVPNSAGGYAYQVSDMEPAAAVPYPGLRGRQLLCRPAKADQGECRAL